MSSVCFIYKGACLSTTVVFMPSCHLYLLGVTLYSLSWTEEFLWHFRSASRTKWLCGLEVNEGDLCLYSLVEIILEKPLNQNNKKQNTFLLSL